MAKGEVSGGKRGRKAAIKADGQAEAAAVGVLEPEDGEPEPPKPRKQKTGIPKNITFFERLARIQLADWGTRAKVTVYRLEPITNNLLGSEKKYIKLYTQPPVTEERIKQDCGSGRYRLYLTVKAPAADEKEVDSVEIDILDLAFPPRVPKGAWLDDPRNSQWAWAKESYEKQNGAAPAAASPQDTILDAIEIVDKLKGNQPDPVKTTLDTIQGVKALLGADKPKDATQELAALVTVAEKLRPPETVPQFVQVQFQALQAEIAVARERGDKLMMLLLDRRKDAPEGFSAIKELVGGLKELLPTVKDMFPGLSEIGNGGGGRARYGPWGQLAVDLMPHVSPILAPITQTIAAGIMTKMSQPNPGMGGAPPPASHPQQIAAPQDATQGAPAQMMPFLQMIAVPMVNHIRFMAPPENGNAQELGKEFAQWIYNGYGADPRYEQAILAARAMGPIGITAAFRPTPLWTDKGPQRNLPSMAELEGRLAEFFTAFLNWTNDEGADEEPEETDPARPVVLTYSEGAEGGYGA